jgi:hypothetical protein
MFLATSEDDLMSTCLGFSHNMAIIGFQWMLHKWQLVHSGGLNILGFG